MAALDRRNPNLDDFVGLNWSCWVDRVNVLPSDAGCNTEDSSKYGKNRSETMTLRKEDMHIYGHCPAHDEMYLVVCSHCGQVVKPQAFEKHCERRHGPFTEMCGQSSTLAPQQRPRPGHPLSNISSRERQNNGRCSGSIAPSSAALPAHQNRPTKAQREAASFPSVEAFPQENPPLLRNPSSTPGPRVPPLQSGPQLLGHHSSSTSPSERPSAQKPTAARSRDSHSPLRGTRTYSRIYKNIDKKECDLNKHRAVVDPERKKLYSQEIICNIDSIHQQQKAMGRTKTFDQLAVEQRAASAGRDMEPLLVESKHKEKHLEAFDEKKATQGSKYNLNSNCLILRSRDPSEGFPEEEGNGTVEVEVQPPYPFNQSLLSSEESEDDEQEEATDLPATPWHPKPLGLCTFGCRTLGCSIFTFDRRWHHLRFALSTMLEHHISKHLWKKMPQGSSGLRSRHVPPPTVGSPVRSVVRPSKSTGSLSLQSTSVETRSSQHNAHSTKAPTSTTSASFGPGRRRNPVGRPGKAQLMEVEQNASAAQKANKLSHNTEDKSSKYVRDAPLHEKGQPHVTSRQGPVNGTFSHGKKQCPPLQCSPGSSGRPSGIQQKVADFDNRSLSHKRKGSSESLPLSSSLSSKCQRLSSPSRSSLLAWKGENIGDVLSWGLERKADS